MSETAGKIEIVLEKVRPYIQMHGGDVRLSEIRGSIAVLKIYGTCVDCTLANLTYNKLVAPLVREEAPEITEVVFE